MSWGLLLDTTRCIGCGACSAACKEQNKLGDQIEGRTTAYTWTTVEQHAGVNVRKMCMHCNEPTCASVCPVGAMRKTPEGPVVYDEYKCIGCRYCIQACPFDVPKYQWDRAVPVVGKCVMCASRLKEGKATACASVCPTGATVFGDRKELITEARSRMATDPGRYVNHIYGLEEVGGTSVLMLSSVPFGKLGFRDNLPKEGLPHTTWRVLSKIPDIVLLGGSLLYGIWWITKRRDVVRRIESPHDPADDVVEVRP